MKPQIVNIINFIRGVEPRIPDLDLLEPVQNQIGLLKKYGLPGTFLIQYDAMLKQEFVDLLKNELNSNCEIGIWLEMVQPLVEMAGIEWRGRPGFSWDWHANVGVTIGYTLAEREKLVDVFMEDFREIFGKYPQSVCSWVIDSHTLAYMADRYGIIASCNCRDQWGTDGYSIWGGYYNQAYYPSRNNVLSPAQSKANQISVPVFRMLGSDPIYQYDAGLICGDELRPSSFQPVITLEPSYPEAGGSPEWVKWYFKENFNGICLSFGYTQVGQENSFGWKAMAEGLTNQLEFIAQKVEDGELKAETLKDSAVWFKARYELTPCSAIAAQSDWKEQGHRSVWFCSRFYRANFFQEKNRFWIRDIHCFDENYSEKYHDEVCTEESLIYDTLPVMDGNRWSGGNIRAGIYLVEIMENNTTLPLTGGELGAEEVSEEELELFWPLEQGGMINLHCCSDVIVIRCNGREDLLQYGIKMIWNESVNISIKSALKDRLVYCHNGYEYCVDILAGKIIDTNTKSEILLCADKDGIVLKLNNT